MKLLFDENLSPKLVSLLAAEFPNSTHIELLDRRGAKDSYIWDYARENGFIIVSKDNDFRQRSFLEGPPPKVIWLSVGNAGTAIIKALLQSNQTLVGNFSNNPNQGLLVLEPPDISQP